MSMSFENKEFNIAWRETFAQDFEGKFQQVYKIIYTIYDWLIRFYLKLIDHMGNYIASTNYSSIHYLV